MAISSASDLPSSNSPTLALVHPTATEKLATWHFNAQQWRGPLSLAAYARREEVLRNQALTRDSGMTFWILVDTSTPASRSREILASCETFRKIALERHGANKAEEVVSHGIGSVFCNPQLRGRGYAKRMLKELEQKLHTWQQQDGTQTNFTVLFSDIGKKFYATMGWQPFPSNQIALPDLAGNKQYHRYEHFPAARPLEASQLAELCKIDETLLKSKMENFQADASEIQVAFTPDVQTCQYHHAREEFVAEELLGRAPNIKGAIVETTDGKRVWCIWTRTFGNTPAENVLHILRLVIEGEIELSSRNATPYIKLADLDNSGKEQVLAAASVLCMAQREAAEWAMQGVQLWNPTPFSVLAAQQIEPSVEVIDREQESIASLRWHGPKPKVGADVDWVAIERFCWC